MDDTSGKHSFVVYVDESGDEGFVFPSADRKQGSSNWFVLAGVVFRTDTAEEQTTCVERVRQQLGKDISDALHFRKLNHHQRVVYTEHVAKASCKAVAVAIHKPDIQSRQRFSQKHEMYRWATQLLFERVSWLCAERYNDPGRPIIGNGKARFIFSKRNNFDLAVLQERLKESIGNGSASIRSSCFDGDSIEERQHEELNGLQIADAIASSVFFALQPHPLGVVEDRYIKTLKPVIYQRDGRYLSYGIKVFPSEGHKLFVERLEDFLRQD